MFFLIENINANVLLMYYLLLIENGIEKIWSNVIASHN